MTIATRSLRDTQYPDQELQPTRFALYLRPKGARTFTLEKIFADELEAEDADYTLRRHNRGADTEVLRLDLDVEPLPSFPNRNAELVVQQSKQARAVRQGPAVQKWLDEQTFGPSVSIDFGRNDGAAFYTANALRSLGYSGGVISQKVIGILQTQREPVTFAVSLRDYR